MREDQPPSTAIESTASRSWVRDVGLGQAALALTGGFLTNAAFPRTLRLLGDAAASVSLADDRGLLPSASPVLHSAAASLVLPFAAVHSVFKPAG